MRCDAIPLVVSASRWDPIRRSLPVRLIGLTAMGATADFLAVLAGSAESKAVGTLLLGIIAMTAARLIGGAEWSTLAFAAVVLVALSKRFAAGGVNTAKPNMKAKIVVITGAATGEWMDGAGAPQRGRSRCGAILSAHRCHGMPAQFAAPC